METENISEVLMELVQSFKTRQFELGRSPAAVSVDLPRIIDTCNELSEAETVWTSLRLIFCRTEMGPVLYEKSES